MQLLVTAIVLSSHGSAAQGQCVGDCGGDGAVSISDLILGVNIALEMQPASACPAFQNAQGQVTIAQLIRAVGHALDGCPAAATATATTPSSGTATRTPPPDATPTDTAAATPTTTTTETPPVSTPTATGPAPATSTSTGTVQATATATQTVGSTATETSGTAATPTHTPTGAPTATSAEHTPTPMPTDGPSPTPTAMPSSTATDAPTAPSTATVTAATATATPTTTATATPSATATETAIPVGELVAGHIAIAAAGLRAVHPLVAAFVSQLSKAGGAVLQDASAPLIVGGPAPDPDACSVSGTSERTCSEMGAGTDKTIHLALDAEDCVVAGPSGGTAEFNGTITVDASPSSANACEPLAFTSGMYEFGQIGALEGLRVTFRDALMEPTLAVHSAVSGTIAIVPPPPPTCQVGTLTLTLDGLLLTRFGDSSAELGIQVTFADTELTVDMITYNADCVPLSYRLKVGGRVSFTATRAGPALVAGGDATVAGIGVEVITGFTADFTNLFVAQEHAGGSVTSEISGQMSSECFGADVMIATVSPVVVGAGDICPNAGQLSLTSFAGLATLTYQGSQVNVAEGGSEKIFPSCLADMLVTCILQ